MNSKILLTIAVAFLLGLATGAFVGKDKDLKEAIANLTAARASLEEAHQHLNSALQLNQDLEKRNDDFGRYMHTIDSVVQRKDREAQMREEQLLKRLKILSTGIEQVSHDILKTSHLPVLPVGTLEEEN